MNQENKHLIGRKYFLLLVTTKNLFAILLLGISILTACSHVSSKDDSEKCDKIMLAPFIEALSDSIEVHPNAVLNIYKKERENTVDSISSYALLNAISLCYFWTGEMDSSMTTLRKVMAYCERAEPTPCLLLLQADAFFKYGVRLAYLRMNDSALVYYKKAYDAVLKSTKRDIRLIRINICLANCYHRKSDYPTASYYYQKALFVTDSLKLENKLRFSIFFSLAELYTEIDNFDMAAYHYRQAEKYLNDVPESTKSYYYDSKGSFYLNTKDYSSALECFRFDYNYVISYSYPKHEERALVSANLGNAYLQSGKVDSARYYINLANEYYELSDNDPLIEFYIDELNTMLALQDNELDKVKKLLEKPYDPAFIEASVIYKYNQHMEEWYAKKKDFKNAYHYRLKVDAYNDSLHSIKVRNNIAEMEMRYRQDTTLLRKDLRIATVEGRAARWKNLASVSVMSLIVLLALSGILVMYGRRKREQDYRRQLAVVTGLRMEIVRNRISPHFMFNALNAVMPTLGQYKELELPFSTLIQMLRNNLLASEQISVPLGDEIKLVQNYLRLQMLGNPGRIHTEWLISDDVPVETRIPSMSIQIPVENAVKYAFEPTQTDARIDIRITAQAGMTHIVIEDNGVGYHPSLDVVNERGTGSGLKMLHRTVELLNLRNSSKMAFRIENRRQLTPGERGTGVTVIIPFDYHFDM